MNINKSIKKWHEFIEGEDLSVLNELLAQDVVFHSPVLHTPQKGKILTKMYLSAAYYVFKDNDFVYTRQVIQGNQAVLEFETVIDGIVINGVDIIECNVEGKFIDFKVMIRPLKGLKLLQHKMFEMLEKAK